MASKSATDNKPIHRGIPLASQISNSAFPYQRIVVVGTTSSGKSTLAERLAKKLDLDFIELDALFWEPNWQGADVEVFRMRVETVTSSQRGKNEDSSGWVVAGNYRKVRDLIWPKAQVIIWLDYPFHIVFWRLLTRTIRRTVTQEELWNGNRETFWVHLKLWSEDSLFNWLFKTYWRRKREIPDLLHLPEHKHLELIHFKHPRETEKWLSGLFSKPCDDLR
jgi:adenylate kinase family enzyme